MSLLKFECRRMQTSASQWIFKAKTLFSLKNFLANSKLCKCAFPCCGPLCVHCWKEHTLFLIRARLRNYKLQQNWSLPTNVLLRFGLGSFDEVGGSKLEVQGFKVWGLYKPRTVTITRRLTGWSITSAETSLKLRLSIDKKHKQLVLILVKRFIKLKKMWWVVKKDEFFI